MAIVKVQFRGVTPLSQSKFINVPKSQLESHADFEERTWRERLHTRGGKVIVPAMMMKNSLIEASKRLGMKVKGRSGKTFTKVFEAGVYVKDDVLLDVVAETVPGEWLFVPSDGKRGGITRVTKCFPKIESWHGTATYLVRDLLISPEIFTDHIRYCGQYVGWGRNRPATGGSYGQFVVEGIEWVNDNSVVEYDIPLKMVDRTLAVAG